MKKHTTPKLAAIFAIALTSVLASVQGQTIFNFPFDEGGTNLTVTDTAQGLQASFGATFLDLNNDTVELTSDSPSGLPGDKSFSNLGKGFLVGNDTNQVLNITNGPITMEAWVKKNSSFAATTEGVVSYGSSFKMGFRTSGLQVFTLLGKVDISSTMTNRLPFDEWVHIATVWQPGVGVTFYIGSNSLYGATNKFVANTNATAVPLVHNYLSIGNEGFANPLVGSFDRVKIHQAALTPAELDEDSLNPKANYTSTKASFDFNDAAFPSVSSVAPEISVTSANELIPVLTGPVWTNGVTGNANDFALYFNGTRRIIFPDPSALITLGGDTSGTNGDYTLQTWVKLPIGLNPTTRMVMFTYQANPSFSFSINTGRRLHTTTLGKDDVVSGAQVPDDNQWHHVAAVHQNGTEVRFYIDGVFLSRMPYIRGPGAQTTFQLTMGGASSITGNPFTGTLDRISLTKGALTPDLFDIPNYVPPAPTPAGDITSELALHLKLDEGSGLTANDSTGGNHNGNLINFGIDNSQWVSGRTGGGLRFLTNAIVTNSTRVNIPDATDAFNFSTNGSRTNSTFSVAAWIYAASPQIQGGGIVAHGFGPEQFALDALSGSNLRFVIRNPAGTAVEVLTIANNNNLRVTNRWIHLVGVFNGAQPTNGLRIYVDGILANASDSPTAVFNKSYDVTVGAREFNSTSGYTQAFQGIIDDVRLYNRALTPADVATLYQAADQARLSLIANGVNGLLTWPITATDFVPQVANSLVNSNTVWVDVPGTATTNGSNKTWPVSLSSTNEFYRLRSAP